MRIWALILILAAGLLSGCVGRFATDYDAALDAGVTRGWRVVQVNFSVPDSLSVGRSDQLAPRTDIVWFGDPPGDRRAQVDDLMTRAISRGANGLQGARWVAINGRLEEFHAVTPAAIAAAPSAVHNITFVLEIVDVSSGTRLVPPTTIRADLVAYTGPYAEIADRQGQTQRVRITNHVAATVAGWLGVGPDVRESFTGFGK